jgi:hypothetical protein
MILIIAWTFSIGTNHVKISETTIGFAVENSEAILQDHDVIIMNTEASIPIFVRLTSEFTPIQHTVRNDKEIPGT